MQLALEQARLAFKQGEVPIGAVLVSSEKVIAAAHNTIEADTDATSHAEIKVIREATSKLDRWRLTDTALYVTVEP